MTQIDGPTTSPDGWRSAGVVVTVVLAALALAVQWGVVTTKLDHIENRLDELIVEARALGFGEGERPAIGIQPHFGQRG